ncbi:hypothetical protein EYZ11_010928 [Aspergillus tanneri]|uniref:Uncharacterized protein n=1 Tax=Aspergillus tanneri TaxID=1220188 RepID=A0A4S3J694_9EURO|nr:uncharacterized protein ATNIH1004_001891 [Aspergillus tanneri]KAA8641426.1 hypothetical protein ATNIH1004_001891 [Aspergillus tanneri]THC89617.1 hypothetical protein EYZ11_010928 [Aspergillus tanneri]
MADHPETLATTSQSVQLQMYHRYKHQRATKHLIDLYEALETDYLDLEEQVKKSELAISHIEGINSRIKECNREQNLPHTLGVIDYGAFLYGWEQKKDRALIRSDLTEFCKRKQYMKGWSCIPPSHNYEYFPPTKDHGAGRWDVLTHWLSLIWSLLKQPSQLELVDDLESKLQCYVSDAEPITDEPTCYFDALSVLISLHEMNRLLVEHSVARTPNEIADNYEREREQLRRMCELQGIQRDWVPADITVERDI